MKKYSSFYVGDRVCEVFRKSEMTQNEFSEKVGISNRTFESIYMGRTKPSLETIVRVANAFDMTVDWFCMPRKK